MLILASASPRREELLKFITTDFKVQKSNVAEDIEAKDAKDLVLILSKAKAQDVYSKNTGATVIGADTVVEIKGKILGKPKDEKEAENMLFMLSGCKHMVHTGICIINKENIINEVITTEVFFNHMSNSDIKEYLASEKYLDMAGAYAIQKGASKFVEKINGCFFNVMGLPVSKIYNILQMLQKVH